MAVSVLAAVAAATQLLTTISEAIAAGKTDITNDQIDELFEDIAVSDAGLSDAIARARAREANGE